MRSDDDAISPQANKEMTFHVHTFRGKLVHLAQKYILQLFFSRRFFLICSYFSTKFQARVLIKKECNLKLMAYLHLQNELSFRDTLLFYKNQSNQGSGWLFLIFPKL